MKTEDMKKFETHARLAIAFAGIAQWYRTAVTMRELSKLNHIQLKDIGITSFDIPAVANNAAMAMERENLINA